MIDLSTLNNTDLISLRVKLEREMRIRKITYTVGEIGEAAAIKFFNSTPGLSNLKAAPTGTKNVDALSRDGDRYSIKTIQRAKKTGTIYPDLENPDHQLFEYILIVCLAEDFSMIALHQFSWEEFKKIRAWDKRMNAWYVPVSRSRLKIGQCLYSKVVE